MVPGLLWQLSNIQQKFQNLSICHSSQHPGNIIRALSLLQRPLGRELRQCLGQEEMCFLQCFFKQRELLSGQTKLL